LRQEDDMGARAVNAGLGLWLFLSAFLWTHRIEQFHNAWATSLAVATMAIWGIQGVRWARWINAVAGGWLLVSSLMWPTGPATFWNHMLVGIVIVMFAVAPSLTSVRRRGSVRT
jgi:hypothetical protein